MRPIRIPSSKNKGIPSRCYLQKDRSEIWSYSFTRSVQLKSEVSFGSKPTSGQY